MSIDDILDADLCVQPLGEYLDIPVLIAPTTQRVIDIAAARISELEADVASLQRLVDRQTTRLAVWIGREAAEA